MGWNLKDNRERIISEINITPLTDVMLVLLVIFMVTTPLIVIRSLKIKLPQAVTSTVESGGNITIVVAKDGAIQVEGRDVRIEDLYKEIKKEITEKGKRTVLLRADTKTMHGIVVRILDTAKQAGADRLSIATEPGDSEDVRIH